jgi:tRNA (guanosine-2'-O-)-methyltransferase
MDMSGLNQEFEIKQKLLEYLLAFVNDDRREKFSKILRQRTRYMTVVLENIFQSHNASAVLRSCECFGIQDVHIIEGRYPYQINKEITLGSSKWLSLSRYRQEEYAGRECLLGLKKKGYKIVATSLTRESIPLEELPLDHKFALVFGTEKEGLSEEVYEQSDMFLKIPMAGFTESLNISVSAAICLYYLSGKLRNSGLPWQLCPEDELEVHLLWAMNTLNNVEVLRRAFYKKIAIN